MARLVLLCLALVAPPAFAQTQVPSRADTQPTTWTDAIAVHAQQVQAAGIVGSSLVIVRDGEVAATGHVGLQDQTTNRPIDAGTIYHWASVTKTFTGIAIMQLRDRGLLTLDDPVVMHVPEFRQVHNPFGPPEQVTVRTLMSHTSGLRAATWPWGGDQPWHPFEPTRWEQLFAMLPYTTLQFAPGTRYSYSNPGVLFLGRIIEQLSGDDYEMYVTKHILMPLGMHRTFFDRAPNHLRPHRSHSYVRDGQGVREAPFDFDTGVTVSNGGLNAPMTDMVRYLTFLLGQGPADRTKAHDQVLARASLEEMWRPVVRAQDGEGGSGNDVQAALSFFVERHGGVELVGHSGQQAGFLSHIYLHRPSRTAWAVAFNTDVAADAAGMRGLTTRAVDDAVRDAMVRLLSGAR
jgi:CubicO group peptidase (beta-lactamase class C family)